MTCSCAFVTFPYGVLGQVWDFIVLILDFCLLPYFFYSLKNRLTRHNMYCAILSEQIVAVCPLGVPISYYIKSLV